MSRKKHHPYPGQKCPHGNRKGGCKACTEKYAIRIARKTRAIQEAQRSAVKEEERKRALRARQAQEEKNARDLELRELREREQAHAHVDFSDVGPDDFESDDLSASTNSTPVCLRGKLSDNWALIEEALRNGGAVVFTKV